MAYGLTVVGDNSVLQIDNTLNMKGLQPIQAGTASSLSSLPAYTDLVFIKKTTTTSNICLDRNYSAGTVTFRIGTTGSTVSVEYIICRAANDPTPSGTYGLQVKNSSGVVAFDSRNFTNTGVEVIDFKTVGSLSNSGTISSSLSNYVLMNWSYYINTSNFAGVTASTILGYRFVQRINGSYTGTNRSEIPVGQAFTS